MALTPRQRLRRIAVRTLIVLAVVGVPTAMYYYKTFHHLRRAVALLGEGKDLEAREALDAHLARNPKDIATRAEYARLLVGDRDLERLVELLDAAPNLAACADARCRWAQRALVSALIDLERPEDADRRLRAFEGAREGADLVAMRVRLERLRGNLDAAARALAAGLEKHPEDLALRTLEAERLAEAGDLTAAAAGLDALAGERKGVERARALTALGKLYRANGEYAQAELALKRALAEDPASVEATYELGQLYLYLGRNRDALAQMRRAIELDPRAYMMAYHVAGRAAVMLKDWETAEAMFDRLQALSSRYADLAREDIALLRRTRLGEREIPEDRTMSVTIRVRGSREVDPTRLSIAGSWTDDGRYDDLAGWRWRAMDRGRDGAWTATFSVRVRTDFGYGFVLDDDEDPATGALYHDRLMLHEMETLPEAVTVDVALSRDRLEPPVRRAPWVQRPADGRQSVYVLWLDSGCWPDLKPLLMRGQVPAIAQFLDGAAYGSLWAERSWTAKALQALTTFNRADHYTLINLTTDLVREMQANAAIGHYFDFVSPATLDRLEGQESLTIWDVLQRNRRVGLNLIFSDKAAFDPNDATLVTAEGERVSIKDRLRPTFASDGETVDAAEVLARMIGRREPGATAGWMENYIVNNYREALRKHRTSLEAVETFKPELAIVRYPELDHISHQFFDGRQQRVPGEERDAPRLPYARVLDGFYRFYDGLLGEMLARTDADDAVFLISDHGILNNFAHAPLALLMARGGGIEASGFIGRNDNHDFPLTLMRLLGLDVPERPRYEAIEPLLAARAGGFEGR